MNKHEDVMLLLKKWFSGLFVITFVGVVSFVFLFAAMYFTSRLI